MNINVQISVKVTAFNSFRFISRSRMGGSNDNWMLNLLRNGQTVFHSSYTILYSYQQCPTIPTSLDPCSFPFFLNCSHPNECEVVLLCGSDLHFSKDYAIFFISCIIQELSEEILKFCLQDK